MIKNQECALMNVCQNTCALGRLVPLRNSADDPRCIVALLFSLTCLLSTPFTLDLLIHLFQVLHFVLPAILLILHSSLYSTFLSLLFFCFSSTLPIFVSTLLCSSHLHSPLPFPLFSPLDSTLHCSSCILFILSTLVYAPIFCKSSWRF